MTSGLETLNNLTLINFGDFNNDKSTDVILTNPLRNNIFVMYQLNNAFQLSTPICDTKDTCFHEREEEFKSAIPGDFTDNGMLDILTISQLEDRTFMRVYAYNGEVIGFKPKNKIEIKGYPLAGDFQGIKTT